MYTESYPQALTHDQQSKADVEMVDLTQVDASSETQMLDQDIDPESSKSILIRDGPTTSTSILPGSGNGESNDLENEESGIEDVENRRCRGVSKYGKANRVTVLAGKNGSPYWLDQGSWQRAVYHNDIRDHLVARMAVFGTYRKFGRIR